MNNSLQYRLETWESTKNRIDQMQFSDLDQRVLSIQGVSLASSHVDGKNVHNTMTEKRTIEENTNYQIEYSWTYCPKCRRILSKRLTGWNNVDRVSYGKTFI